MCQGGLHEGFLHSPAPPSHKSSLLCILPVALFLILYCLQDLEIWLSKEEVANGYTLVSRSGKSLQEVHVTTAMSRNDMKTLLSDVLRRTM